MKKLRTLGREVLVLKDPRSAVPNDRDVGHLLLGRTERINNLLNFHFIGYHSLKDVLF